MPDLRDSASSLPSAYEISLTLGKEPESQLEESVFVGNPLQSPSLLLELIPFLRSS